MVWRILKLLLKLKGKLLPLLPPTMKKRGKCLEGLLGFGKQCFCVLCSGPPAVSPKVASFKRRAEQERVPAARHVQAGLPPGPCDPLVLKAPVTSTARSVELWSNSRLPSAHDYFPSDKLLLGFIWDLVENECPTMGHQVT